MIPPQKKYFEDYMTGIIFVDLSPDGAPVCKMGKDNRDSLWDAAINYVKWPIKTSLKKTEIIIRIM